MPEQNRDLNAIISNLMHYAAVSNGAAQVLQILKDSPKAASGDDKGVTALHYAAANNNTQTIKTLLEFGANINAKDFTSLTPLHWCLNNNPINFETVTLLLNAGANLVSVIEYLKVGETFNSRINAMNLKWLESQIKFENIVKFNDQGKDQLRNAIKYYQNSKKLPEKIANEWLQKTNIKQVFEMSSVSEEGYIYYKDQYADWLFKEANKINDDLFLTGHDPKIVNSTE
jgi:ankyrin repeat protein